MPFLKSAEYAGKKIFDRLTKGKEFEIEILISLSEIIE